MSEPQGTRITCYKCGSTNWDCIDEHNVTCIDRETGEEYQCPEGWLRCKDCGATWSDGGCEDGDEELDTRGEW